MPRVHTGTISALSMRISFSHIAAQPCIGSPYAPRNSHAQLAVVLYPSLHTKTEYRRKILEICNQKTHRRYYGKEMPD